MCKLNRPGETPDSGTYQTDTCAQRARLRLLFVRDSLPASAPVGKIGGFQLTTRHDHGPSGSTALDLGRGKRVRRLALVLLPGPRSDCSMLER